MAKELIEARNSVSKAVGSKAQVQTREISAETMKKMPSEKKTFAERGFIETAFSKK